MKKVIASLFVASTLLVGAPLPAMAGIDVAAVCDGSVPDAWKRPGGFCDQNNFNNSLSDSSEPGCAPLVAMIGGDRDARMLLAVVDPCRPRCTSVNPDFFDIDARDRVVLAAC